MFINLIHFNKIINFIKCSIFLNILLNFIFVTFLRILKIIVQFCFNLIKLCLEMQHYFIVFIFAGWFY